MSQSNLRILLIVFTLVASLFAQPTVTYKYPSLIAEGPSASSNIRVTFSENILTGSITSSSFNVDGAQTGLIAGTYSGGGTSEITFNPSNDFKAGEVITVTLTIGITNTSSVAMENSVTWKFTVASSSGSTEFQEFPISTSADYAYIVYAADLDRDGDMDVLSASHNDCMISWYENNGSQVFTKHTAAFSCGVTSVYTADVDGDGDLDLLSASNSNDRISWYKNNGSQAFNMYIISDSADLASSVYAADVDGDGDIDVLSTSVADDKIAWYKNDGSESFSEQVISDSADGAQSVYAADVDGDGDLDVLSALANDNMIAWYENDGSESFSYHLVGIDYYATSVYAEDMDWDGDLDILSTSASSDEISWYENNGSQVFTKHTVGYADNPRNVYVADINGDGCPDVLSASSNDDKIAWYEHNGSSNYPAFTSHTISDSADGAHSVYAADVDGDGDLDVLSASFYDDKIAWYENTNAPSVSTSGISLVTARTAFSGGTADDRGASITARGVCWSTSANPTTADSKTSDGTGDGSFTSEITGLSPGKTYHVRAYATNSLGTSYGEDISFTTITPPDHALDFDGDNDHVSIPHSSIGSLTGSFSVEAWFNVSGGTEDCAIISKHHNDNGSRSGYTIEYSGTNSNIHAVIGYDGGWYPTEIPFNSLNEWHHVAMTYNSDSDELKLYLDGILMDTATGATTPQYNSSDLWIGGSANYVNNYFQGSIDQVRIWNDMRTATEIQDNMHRALSETETNLVAYYSFDHSSGTTLSDAAGANDGTLTYMTDDDWVTSLIPVGETCAFVNTTSQTTVGDAGKQLKATITTGGDDSNYLGIYQTGDGTDKINSGETFPSGITQRSDIFWGVEEFGTVTADLIIDYSQVGGISTPTAIRLLKRADCSSVWTDVTSSYTHDINNRTFTATGVTSFSEFSVGDGGDNSLPVELSAFYAEANERSQSITIHWVTESELDNLGFILERRAVSAEQSEWIKIANYITDSRLQGHGSVTYRTEYSYTDETVEEGEIYDYRLADVSYDGTITYHDLFLTGVEIKQFPTVFKLYPNYPNPFNPITTINYDLPEDCNVNLIIYDIMGRQVLKLVDEHLQAGYKSIRWNGRNVSGQLVGAGMYLYAIEAGKHTAIRKMVLLK